MTFTHGQSFDEDAVRTDGFIADVFKVDGGTKMYLFAYHHVSTSVDDKWGHMIIRVNSDDLSKVWTQGYY